jgi:Domain of unknown function (DUF397)
MDAVPRTACGAGAAPLAVPLAVPLGVPLADAMAGWGELVWVKSRRSGPQGNCVEMAELPSGREVAVRNSRHPNGPLLVYSTAEIRTWIRRIKLGEFDHLLCGPPHERQHNT